MTETDTLIRRVNEAYSPKQSVQSTAEAKHFEPVTRRRNNAIATAVAFGAGVQYTFIVEARQSGLGGSPSVLVFLIGSKKGGEKPYFVGKTSFIQQTNAMESDADQSTVHSVVPLTNALEAKAESGELPGMDSLSVKAYLNEKLEWKIVKVCF